MRSSSLEKLKELNEKLNEKLQVMDFWQNLTACLIDGLKAAVEQNDNHLLDSLYNHWNNEKTSKAKISHLKHIGIITDKERLYRNSRALIATALAAATAKRFCEKLSNEFKGGSSESSKEAAQIIIDRWNDIRLSGIEPPYICWSATKESSAPLLPEDFLPKDCTNSDWFRPQTVLKQLYQQLHDESFFPAYYWTLYWLNNDPEKELENFWRTTVYVVAIGNDEWGETTSSAPDDGFITEFELSRFDEIQTPYLIEHPESALYPFRVEMDKNPDPLSPLYSFHRAWEMHQHTVVWRTGYIPIKNLNGNSWGGAAARAFYYSKEKLIHDKEVIVSASIKDNKLGVVGSLKEKIEYVCKHNEKVLNGEKAENAPAILFDTFVVAEDVGKSKSQEDRQFNIAKQKAEQATPPLKVIAVDQLV